MMNPRQTLFLAMLVSACILFFPFRLNATTEYAQQTGRECVHCHVDVIGGGALTQAGEQFLSDLQAQGLHRRLTTTQHLVRLVIGYLHMLAAVAWFGTILYVHLLLKPAYASKGLPKGELRLGWLSMVVVLVTGVLLTIARMPDLDAFVTTRFGILLTVKIALFLVMLSSALVVTTYIGPRMRKRMKSPVAALVANAITPEQLAHFDGKDGRKAYIAYKGMVYDVTNGRFWKNGSHMVKHLAGTDLTAALSAAPHQEDKVLAMPQVGMLAAPGSAQQRPFHERLFYVFAYMNLVLVFVIIFVISLWRWW